MENFAEHPTVKHFYEERTKRGEVAADRVLDAAWLRLLCLDAGADDVGFVERDRPEIADQKADIENVFPRTRTLISVVCRMNRENIRTPARSISNLEFHHTTDETNGVALRIVSALEEVGIGAINGGAVGFPMEADRWGSKMWVISHKPVAVAAGLGQMGIHRNVIHPKFGNFILLGTVLVDAEIGTRITSEISRRFGRGSCGRDLWNQQWTDARPGKVAGHYHETQDGQHLRRRWPSVPANDLLRSRSNYEQTRLHGPGDGYREHAGVLRM